jgi:hypothetical protein
MTRNDLRKIQTGDTIVFKRGYINAGCHATFVRIVPDGKSGSFAPTIEYEFGGLKQLTHRAFVRLS